MAVTVLPQSFSLPRGEDAHVAITMSPATNVTGWTVQFLAKASLVNDDVSTPPTLTLDNSTAGSLTISNAATGVFTLAFAADDTEDLDPNTFSWTLRRIDSGAVTTIASGALYLLP